MKINLFDYNGLGRKFGMRIAYIFGHVDYEPVASAKTPRVLGELPCVRVALKLS